MEPDKMQKRDSDGKMKLYIKEQWHSANFIWDVFVKDVQLLTLENVHK